VLGDLPVHADSRVLIDYRTADDAGVYRLDEKRALVQTVDFFTPIVDDPIVYGRIAAANALSDVYAMGGRPLTALAIAAFPKDGDRAVLRAIFSGGLDTLREAGVALLGGHTVQDQEIKFGYAVTGEVDPLEVWANAGALPGDVLILTKAIGTGVVATALKFGRAPEATVTAAVRSMQTTNRRACEALRGLGRGTVHACTDVTGFGLIGHACAMAAASEVPLAITAASVPLIPGARELARGNVSAGGRTNTEHFSPCVETTPGIDPDFALLLYDPQTSGGLLVAVSVADEERTLNALQQADVAATAIGSVLSRGSARVVIR
jgi:selenide,water dikinase